MRRRFQALGGLLLLMTTGWACAHTDEEAVERDRAQDRETAVLKERVARLERRTSDLDARMDLLAGRLGETGPDDRVSSSPPEQKTQLPPPPVPKGPPRIGIGRDAVNILPEPEPEPEPEASLSSVSSGPAPPASAEDEVVVIDDAALARFGLTPAAKDPAPAATEVAPRAKPPKAERRKKSRRTKGGPVKALYDGAHHALSEGQYNTAIERFDEVLRRFPKHHLADNALYWTGVCHQRRGAYTDAVRTFEKVPVRFPKSAKIPDAMYGLAEIAEAQGDAKLAQRIYAQLVKSHPKAERATDAKSALARLSGPS